MDYIFDLDDTLILHHNKEVRYDWIYEDIELSYHLDQCQGKKYILTNGTRSHAETILEKMKLRDKFERVFTREDFGYKPELQVFQKVHRAIQGEDPSSHRILFFDDMYGNLISAKRLGWSTCWIHPYYESAIFNDSIDDGYQNIKDALRYLNQGIKYKYKYK